MAATWRAHLQPSPPGWLDLGLSVPTMDSSRARNELGWRPSVSSLDALLEVVGGMRDSAGGTTPPLDPATSGRLREREVLTGVQVRNASASISGVTPPSTPSPYDAAPMTTCNGTIVTPHRAATSAGNDAVESVTRATVMGAA